MNYEARMKLNLEDLENIQPIHIVKLQKAFTKQKLKNILIFNQSSQQKPGSLHHIRI